MVFPYVAGGGKRLFVDGTPPAAFELQDKQQAGQTVYVAYTQAAAA